VHTLAATVFVVHQPPIDLQRARSFGGVADEYERGRPSYPLEAIIWLLGWEPLDVVELGAGTGKLTARLVEAGHRVIAVEPSAGMRAVLAERVPGVQLVTASAEDTGLAERSADAVVAAAAFHWFDRSRAFPEISRILRVDGTLGLIGSRFDQTTPWAVRLRSVLGEPSRTGTSRHWPERDELGQWFQETEEDHWFPFTEQVDRQRLIDYALSRSTFAVLPPDEQRAAAARVGNFWDTDPDLRGQQTAELAYQTLVRRARGVRLPPG
jgi:SAM-dependent methyltransferase